MITYRLAGEHEKPKPGLWKAEAVNDYTQHTHVFVCCFSCGKIGILCPEAIDITMDGQTVEPLTCPYCLWKDTVKFEGWDYTVTMGIERN